jgi:hypothetical protein
MNRRPRIMRWSDHGIPKWRQLANRAMRIAEDANDHLADLGERLADAERREGELEREARRRRLGW